MSSAVDARSGGIQVGRLAGLRLVFEPSAVAGSVVLWVAFAAAGRYLFHSGLTGAVVGGFAAMLLHWVAETVHQFGHATAARSTGYPMTGIDYFMVISRAEYPRDEPELPPATHIRRALGGPMGGLVISGVALAAWLAMRGLGVHGAWVGLIFLLDSFLTFTLGAFLPLGFTDGSTLLYWMRRR
jgi:hypothetical protein